MILYVVRYHPALTETFVRDEIQALRESGLEIELAAFDAREPGSVSDPAPVHRQPHRWGWLRELPGLIVEWLRRPVVVSRRVLWLSALVRRARRVHVHFGGEAAEWAKLACARAGVPYSLTLHAVDLYKPVAGLPQLLAGARAVVTMTAYNQRLVAEKYGISARLVRFGVRAPEATGPSEKTDVQGAYFPNLPVVLSVGRNVPKKGLDVLCRVATRLDRRAEVVIYSNLPPTEGVSVRGLVSHEQVLSAMGQARVFVLPCRIAPDGDMDGLPVALVEAMAVGVPVITTAVSGIPELVDDSVGWIVPCDDDDALLAAIREALDNPELAAAKGRLGRQRVAERLYTRGALVAAMREVLSQ